MAYTFLQAQTECFDRGLNYLNDGANGTTRVKAWINAAYREVNDMDDWPYLEATATGAAPLTIADLGSIESVINTATQYKLTPVDRRSLTDYYPVLTTTGAAAFYFVSAGTVVAVYPIDPSPIQVLYWKNAPALAAAGDNMLIPDPFQELVILGAMRRGLGEDTDATDVQLYTQEWERTLAQMREALMGQQEDKPQFVAQNMLHEWS